MGIFLHAEFVDHPGGHGHCRHTGRTGTIRPTATARDEAQRKLRLRVERLRAKEEEFGQFQRNGMRELNKSRVTAEEELIEDITRFVREYCRNKGYRVVYDVNGRSLNRVPVILLHPAEDEITAAIVTEMNQGKEEERAKAKAELEALRRAGKSTEEPAAPAAQ